MGLDFRILPKNGYLYVEVSGTFDMGDAKEGSVTDFLVTKVHDLVFEGKIKNIHLAYVGDELVDPEKFGQMLARSRGVSVKVTTEINEALQWLGVKE